MGGTMLLVGLGGGGRLPLGMATLHGMLVFLLL
jgi:hypothetical protein